MSQNSKILFSYKNVVLIKISSWLMEDDEMIFNNCLYTGDTDDVIDKEKAKNDIKSHVVGIFQDYRDIVRKVIINDSNDSIKILYSHESKQGKGSKRIRESFIKFINELLLDNDFFWRITLDHCN